MRYCLRKLTSRIQIIERGAEHGTVAALSAHGATACSKQQRRPPAEHPEGGVFPLSDMENTSEQSAQTLGALPDSDFHFIPSPAAVSHILRQYRIIGQERFASKFCVLTRRGFEAILSYCKKSQQSQGTKFPQSAAAFIVRCCLKPPK